MSSALVLCRILLAGVFALAGLAKLVGRRQSRRDAISLGVGPGLATAVVVGLCVAELGLAVALLLEPAARAAGLAAVVLLGAGMALTAWNLARGRRPDCGCFGSLRRTRIGGRTIARDALLAAMATFVALAGPDAHGSGLLASIVALPLGAAVGLAGMACGAGGLLLARRAAAKRLAVALGEQAPLS